MRSTKLLPQQILLIILGLSALVIPLVLIFSNFRLVALFVKPVSQSADSQNPANKEATTLSTTQGFELLDTGSFESRSKGELVVVLDQALVGTNYLMLSTGELGDLIASETSSSLQETFKGTTLILVTTDLVTGQKLATSLGEKGILTALYLIND